MSEAYEHNPGDHEDPLAGSTWMIGLLSTVLFVVICLGITAVLYHAQRTEFTEKVLNTEVLEIARMRQTWGEQLNAPPHYLTQLTDQGEDRAVVIPIESAMEIISREY